MIKIMNSVYRGLNLTKTQLFTLLISMNKARLKHRKTYSCEQPRINNSTLFQDKVNIAFVVDAKSLAFPELERDLEP